MSSISLALIQTPCYELEDDRLEPNLGLLYLATWLRQHGFAAQVIDLSSIPPEGWQQTIPPANVYGFSTYTTSYHRTLQISRLIREAYPAARMVAGGPHASALPHSVAQDFDYVVVGEGENAILRLMDEMASGRMSSPILCEPPIADLDTLPFPDYSLVDVSSYHRVVDGSPSLSVLTSRGCPYDCVFCNSIIMGGRQRVRFRSAENVADEIRRLKARYGITCFRFQDDVFTLSLPRLHKLTALLQGAGITYRCFGRVDQCSHAMAELLFAGGCRHIAFGVESGAPTILERMHKRQTVDQIRHGIANARAAGLVVRAYLLVGFPGETWQTVEETVNLMLECRPEEFSIYPLIPYPGTPVYEQPERFGITTTSDDFSQYFQVRRGRGTGFVYRTPDLDEQIVAEMRRHVIERLEGAMTWAGDSKLYK
jgi:anaerobic magnesium-protoporphyrin IX monomethyl ester cyclase